MAVECGWRGRGVGTALVEASISWARARLAQVEPERVPPQRGGDRLYRRFGFGEEGRRIKHFRRANGELWDSIEMGLLL